VIFTNSRYATGTITKAIDSRSKTSTIAVFRKFPKKTVNFIYYIWAEGDRIDALANKFLDNPARWSDIMDINPEILDPFNIGVGTKIRIPRG
jgi:hypothetical protein